MTTAGGAPVDMAALLVPATVKLEMRNIVSLELSENWTVFF